MDRQLESKQLMSDSLRRRRGIRGSHAVAGRTTPAAHPLRISRIPAYLSDVPDYAASRHHASDTKFTIYSSASEGREDHCDLNKIELPIWIAGADEKRPDDVREDNPSYTATNYPPSFQTLTGGFLHVWGSTAVRRCARGWSDTRRRLVDMAMVRPCYDNPNAMPDFVERQQRVKVQRNIHQPKIMTISSCDREPHKT